MFSSHKKRIGIRLIVIVMDWFCEIGFNWDGLWGEGEKWLQVERGTFSDLIWHYNLIEWMCVCLRRNNEILLTALWRIPPNKCPHNHFPKWHVSAFGSEAESRCFVLTLLNSPNEAASGDVDPSRQLSLAHHANKHVPSTRANPNTAESNSLVVQTRWSKITQETHLQPNISTRKQRQLDNAKLGEGARN